MTPDSVPIPTRDQPAPGIFRFVLGDYQTNCYLVTKPGDHTQGWVADCGFEPDAMLNAIEAAGISVRRVLLTHAHLDHIAGLFALRRRFPDAPIAVHREERLWLGDPERNLSAFSGKPITAPEADELLEDAQTLDVLGEPWTILHTPGHSPGGVAFYSAQRGVTISGDALFFGSIGRTDFPGCDEVALHRSIREKLYTLPDDTLVLSGHGPETTIGREKAMNLYVQA